MALRDILITPAPRWLVGEGAESPENLLDKDGRRTIPIPAGPDDHYPDDYAGKVIAERPAGWRWTEMDLAGGRKVVQMDLTGQESGWVSSRTRKIINGKRELITFEDRWGSQVAARLRERFDDVEDAELRSTDPYDYIGRQFAAQSVLFKKLLTPTVVHTGAGLYEVGPAKTYSTWGSALAQLFTDQGSAEFTAIQYIRGFADTYDETVSPSTSLNPSEASGYPLVLEGDPTDSRNNIHVAPSSGRGVWGRPDFVLVRHLKITTTNSNAIQSSVTDLLLVHDCIITAPATAMGVQSFAVGVNVEDCVIVAGTYGIEATSSTRSLSVRRCAISGNGAAGASYGVAAIAGADCPVVVDGCTIANFASAGSAAIYTDDVSAPIIASNNTFFNCTSGLRVIRSQGVTSINNIFDSCTYNYYSNIWPDEAVEGSITETWALRNNCYKAGYTGFAYNGAASKTHAEFVAFDLVDEDGDLVDTDPLLTNPGAGDFSLGVGSPCINAGHGSGVITGSNGVAYDPNNPDIGGYSTGALPAAAAPTWAANTSNIAATDLGSDGDVGLAWDAATPDASGDVGYIIESQETAAPGTWAELFRTIQTAEIAAGLTNTTPYDFRVKAYTRVTGEPTTTPVDTDSATPTAAAAAPSAPTITNVAISDKTVTVTVSGAAGVNQTARLATFAALEVDEQSRVGPGDIVLTADNYGDHTVVGWASNVGGRSEPSAPAVAYVTTPTSGAATGCGILERTPHTIRLVRPTRNRDATTGASRLDYASPVSDRQVTGFMSTSGGTVDRGAEGEVLRFDAVWFTNDSDFEVDDQAIVAIPGLSGNFLVIGTEPKYDLDGDFDHNEVLLSKDNKR